MPLLIADLLRGDGVEALTGRQLTAGLAFAVIGIGALGAITAGHLSQRLGSPKVAAVALAISGFCCLMYPFARPLGSTVCLILLLVWGFSVVADSAQFSATSARVAPPDLVGSALAIQNSIGFFITVVSILLLTSWIDDLGAWVAWLLLPGPIVGLLFFRPMLRDDATR